MVIRKAASHFCNHYSWHIIFSANCGIRNGTLKVPRREYTTESDLYCGVTTDGDSTTYATMATSLFSPTFSTVLSNSVLQVQSSSSNLTYNMQFFGPAVSCDMAGDEAFSWAKKAMLGYEQTTR